MCGGVKLAGGDRTGPPTTAATIRAPPTAIQPEIRNIPLQSNHLLRVLADLLRVWGRTRVFRYSDAPSQTR